MRFSHVVVYRRSRYRFLSPNVRLRVYCLGGETYKPIIPLFLRSLTENRGKEEEGDERERTSWKEPEKNQFSMILFRTSRVVVPFSFRNRYEQLNFRFLETLYSPPLPLPHTVSIPLVNRYSDRTGKEIATPAPRRARGVEGFPSDVPLSFFDRGSRGSRRVSF